MAVAVFGVRALVALSPPGLPRAGAIGSTARVFAFGLGITTLIGLAFGLIPALQAPRSDPQRNLQHGSPAHRRRTPAHSRRARRRGSRARARAARELGPAAAEPPAAVRGRTAASMRRGCSRCRCRPSGHRFDDDRATYRFFEDALDAVRRVPGVTAAALTSQLPLSGDRDEYGAHFEATPTRAAETYSAFRYAVSPGYIETMGIPLRRGRLLDEHDRAGAPLVALISESLANGTVRPGRPDRPAPARRPTAGPPTPSSASSAT